MELDHEHTRRSAQQSARTLPAAGARRADGVRGCPLERLVGWIASRRAGRAAAPRHENAKGKSVITA